MVNSTPSSQFYEYNEQKPLALFIVCDPKTDHNGVFSDKSLRSFQKTVGKTHEIIVTKLEDASLIKEHMRIASEQYGQGIDHLFLCAHGNEEGMYFGTDPDKGFYRLQDVRPEDFRSMAFGGKVYCIGCSTAPLAQRIAAVANLYTIGPRKNTSARVLVSVRNQYHVMDKGGELIGGTGTIFTEFFPGGYINSYPVDEQEARIEIVNQAEDDADSQYWLGFDAILRKDRKMQHHWLRKAASLGNSSARVMYLRKERSDLDPETQERWVKEILDECYPSRANDFGSDFEQVGKLEWALRFYEKAALEGLVEARENYLRVFYLLHPQ